MAGLKHELEDTKPRLASVEEYLRYDETDGRSFVQRMTEGRTVWPNADAKSSRFTPTDWRDILRSMNEGMESAGAASQKTSINGGLDSPAVFAAKSSTVPTGGVPEGQIPSTSEPTTFELQGAREMWFS